MQALCVLEGEILDLKYRILDSDLWPDFNNADFLVELDDLANEAISKKSIEGYLAALLIYHQLSEEMIRLLIEDSKFFIELSIYPAEMKFPKKNKSMFGNALAELREGIEFPDKDKFINKCSELNQFRNQIVHKLTKQTALTDVKCELNKISKIYTEIYETFEDSHDWYRLCFKDYKKDVFA